MQQKIYTCGSMPYILKINSIGLTIRIQGSQATAFYAAAALTEDKFRHIICIVQ